MTEKHDPEKLNNALEALNNIGDVVLNAAPIIAMLAGPEAVVFFKLGKPVLEMLQKHFNNLGRGDINLALKDIKLGNTPFEEMLKEAKLGGYLDSPEEDEPEEDGDDDDAIVVDDPDSEDEGDDTSTMSPPDDIPDDESNSTEENETPSEGDGTPPPESDPTES